MTSRIMLVAAVCGARLASAAPLPAALGPWPTDREAVDAATKLETTYRAKLSASDRPIVVGWLASADKASDKTNAALTLTNAAAFLSTQGAHPAVFIALAAHAAQLAPNAGVAWTDLGALVRQVDARASLIPSRRAISLQPEAPLAFVNLGSSLAELGDKSGEIALRQAIGLAPTLGVAHQSLAAVLLVNGDTAGAKSEVALAMQDGVASPGIEQLAAAVKLESLPVTAQPSISYGNDTYKPGATKHAGSMATLILPGEVPHWQDVKEFLTDSSWQELGAKLLAESMTMTMSFAMKYYGTEMAAGMQQMRGKIEQQMRSKHPGALPARADKHDFDLGKYFGSKGVPHSPFSDHEREKLEALALKYTATFKKSSDLYLAKVKAGMDVYKTEMKSAQKQLEQVERSCASGADPMKCICELATTWQREIAPPTERAFQAYVAGVSYWSQMRKDLLAFWRDSAEILEKIDDQPTFAYAEELRRVLVTGWTAAFWGPMSMYAIPFGIGTLMFQGACASTPPPAPVVNHAPAQQFVANVETKAPCVIPPIGVKFLGITAKIDCEKGELSFTDVVAVGVKYDWKSREMETFVGAGASMALGDAFELKAKVGLTMTSVDGKIVDVGGKSDVGIATKLPVLDMKVSVTATISLATPATVEAKGEAGFMLEAPKDD